MRNPAAQTRMNDTGKGRGQHTPHLTSDPQVPTTPDKRIGEDLIQSVHNVTELPPRSD